VARDFPLNNLGEDRRHGYKKKSKKRSGGDPDL
jgi:hypothetical protein